MSYREREIRKVEVEGETKRKGTEGTGKKTETETKEKQKQKQRKTISCWEIEGKARQSLHDRIGIDTRYSWRGVIFVDNKQTTKVNSVGPRCCHGRRSWSGFQNMAFVASAAHWTNSV
jgi:hypothetical protein